MFKNPRILLTKDQSSKDPLVEGSLKAQAKHGVWKTLNILGLITFLTLFNITIQWQRNVFNPGVD